MQYYPLAFNDNGEVALITLVTHGTFVTHYAVVRYIPGIPSGSIELIAYENQPAPGSAGRVFSQFRTIGMNRDGTISFVADLLGDSQPWGIFRQVRYGSLEQVVLQGQETNLPVGGRFSLANMSMGLLVVLNSGATFFSTDIVDGMAEYGVFLGVPGLARVLMSTGDPLPPGSRIMLRAARVVGQGGYIGLQAQRNGGRISIIMHSVVSHSSSVVATEGEAAPGGGRLADLSTYSYPQLNAGGDVTFQSAVVGGANDGKAALFFRKYGQELIRIAGGGDTDPVTGRVFEYVQFPNNPMPAINSAGDVVFYAGLEGTPFKVGAYLRSSNGVLSKIATTGDPAPNGGVFGTFSSPWGITATSICLNDAGQVAFVGSTLVGDVQRSGIFIGSAANGLATIVEGGSTGPDNTIFTGFSNPRLDNYGNLAFVGTLQGGARGGVFVASALNPLQVLALDGKPAPAGGYFSITRSYPVVQINDRGDVAFYSDLSGGNSSAGFFVRRGASGTLAAAVLQGQLAPGTSGTFEALCPGSTGTCFQLSNDGDLAFRSFCQAGGVTVDGIWHVKADNSVEEILVRGDVDPEFGGGTAGIAALAGAWNSGGRYPIFARVVGGTISNGIFLFVPASETVVPAGTNVTVAPRDDTTQTMPATLTFENVTQGGVSSLTSSAASPQVPSNFALGEPPIFYDVSTTATFSGTIEFCVDITGVQFPEGSSPRLLHYENGSWVDVTIDRGAEGMLCGRANSLSPFVAALPTVTLDVRVTPNVLWPPNNKMVRISATIVAGASSSSIATVALVSITSDETLAPDDIKEEIIGTDCRTFLLRASRNGSGVGRTYSITYRVTDTLGNSALKTVTVIVPHDKGAG